MNGLAATLLVLGTLPLVSPAPQDSRGDFSGFAGPKGAPRAGWDSVNVEFKSQIDLATFNAGNGNDIWGYVSPSGREYALVGLSNKVAFVEVTDPSNPVYFAFISHTSSQWADLETYQNYLYVVTEATGTGIQVINLANIDNHQVTLVRTVSSPGRTHTLSIDQTSGFLYTNGSRDGTGTSMCFSLTDPSNPSRVGASSMTTAYQHDTRPVTFTSGPYAGRQILFGSGEGRGLEIWDVTNKNAPFLVVRRSYPQVRYCHQSWLSPDYKYMYVNDELDETNFGINTRTLVFDVEDITNPILLGTFSTGLQAIDHNLYLKKGFLFESNYTSGVRIFNTNINKVSPPESGWFDTYPENNGRTFNGTWSNYPFLPSGTLLVCDINRGLFVLDPTEATVMPVDVTTVTVVKGLPKSGTVASLTTVDNDKMYVHAGPTSLPNEAPIEIILEGTALWQDCTKLRLVLNSNSNTPNLAKTIEMWDWTIGDWVSVGASGVNGTPDPAEIMLTNPNRFIQPGLRTVKARIKINQTGPVLVFPYAYAIDQAGWKINP